MGARVIKSKSGNNQTPTIRIKAGASQTIVEGDLVTIGGIKATGGATNIAGIAIAPITTTGTVGANDFILVQPANNVIARIPYIGTTKTTLTDADIAAGTAFDIGAGMTLNLDDTTGGMMKVVGYDNTAKTADVVFAAAALAL